ncbi:3-hydroxyacyl-CoA dehydrogenase NAD-binding domain-containing protein [Rhodothalassium salexigens]|uniref:3-hydroxyacyl-CoA dehydrogenase NAD-binding domain-containing protein n=1 Tax=Rhodothalassium salexigens TaxID=1086 RepID=UPI001912310F
MIDGDVAVLWIDNPPVNALSQGVRAGLAAALDALAPRDDVRALVIACRGRSFVAGADVREFDRPPQPPSLPDLFDRLARIAKPAVAAIHGQALGGGLELALVCDARVVAHDARLGLPEVTLGLIPGAGGTQRLPRLIGIAPALDLIVSGRPVSAPRAEALGLADRLVPADTVVSAAVELARTLDRKAHWPLRAAADAAAVDAARRRAETRHRGEPARAAAIDAVADSARLDLAAGLVAERARFATLKASPQAAALRHLFFAERAAAKLPADLSIDRATDRASRHPAAHDVARLAVVGAGTMGRGIAMAAADGGLPVTLIDQSADALEAAQAAIAKRYDGDVAKGRLSDADARARRERVITATEINAVADADLVIEAVFEDLAVKRALFADLDLHAKPDAVLATNTSYLDVDAIAAATRRPEAVLGLHFFSPAHVMRLLEVVRAAATGPETLATGLALARRLGKVAVVAGVGHGFIGNRMLQGLVREAGLMLLEGAEPQAVDAALVDFGMALGPFATMDMAGLDIGYAMRRQRDPAAYEVKAFATLDRLVEAGRKGVKTGAGVYAYGADGRTPVADPVTLDLARAVAAAHGVARRAIAADEIVDRCTLALVVEAGRLLDDGIAQKPGDIDMVYVNGYGFPRWRGGPLFHARQRGWDAVRRRLAEFAEQFGPRWWAEPPALARLAKDAGPADA